jgi:hypothetical protein
MNSRNRKTLEDVFSQPTKRNIKWSDIEDLLVSLGAKIKKGRGSRIRLEIQSEQGEFTLTAHRPHPGKEAKEYQVKDARDFLENIGVKP